MNEKMPVFVKIEEYKDVLDILSVIKGKISDAKEVLNEITELKEKEDSQIDSWNISMEDIDKKIEYLDHTLFEPENT